MTHPNVLESYSVQGSMAVETPAFPPLPLVKRTRRRNGMQRSVELGILLLLLSLLVYRAANIGRHGNEWVVALLCEAWFAFTWTLVVSTKWNQRNVQTFPKRLLEWTSELPPVDMFVTTADPVLEPPILTVNTVLSLLAVDYPANLLSCYVSDDGCSPLTFYALVEASKFAKLWVPFCKRFDLPVRAPFRYFTAKSVPPFDSTSLEFRQEWNAIKDEYGRLCKKIEYAAQRLLSAELADDLAAFSNVDRKNHPAIVKVLWENKEALPDGLPHLVYISREKRPTHPHHFKAGAMNVLTRVSGVLTNAPFMLNVDCDMYANDPQVVLRAMCLFLDAKDGKDCAFVQCPQYFYNGLKDDPYGNQFKVLHEYIGRGMESIQGPSYQGTGCFHTRAVIYGLSPAQRTRGENMGGRDLQKAFGKSTAFEKSASQALSELTPKLALQTDLVAGVDMAAQVAGCTYEHGTSWGTQVGFMYGSAAEDTLTGLTIHGKGWRSGFWSPDPRPFLGCSPSSGPALMTQQKRWATGLLEVLIGPKSPIVFTLRGRLQFRQCLAYLWIICWGLRPVPELCYAVLPAYCIITNSHFLPRVNEPAIVLPVAIFVIYILDGLHENFRIGLSVRTWWNNHRMARVNAMTSWLFGLLSVVLKLLGLFESVFEITQKEQNTGDGEGGNAQPGRLTFDESPVFVPGTAVLLITVTALVIKSWRLAKLGRHDEGGPGFGEIVCGTWVLLCFWGFFRGLFANGIHGIPPATIWKSGALTFLFLCLGKWTSSG